MNFQFNENGCRVIKDFYESKIKQLKEELESVRALVKQEKEPQIRAAYIAYIAAVEKRIAECRSKVSEMDAYLDAEAGSE